MELNLNADQEQICDMLRRFLADLADEGQVDQRLIWERLAEVGLQSIILPERLGGFAGTPEDIFLALVEAGRVPTLDLRLESLAFAGHFLSNVDNDYARALLEEVAAGTKRPAVALQNSTADAGPALGKTILSSAEGGLRLNGKKILVIDGAAADVLLVSAERLSEDGAAETVVLAIDPASSGVQMRPYKLVDRSDVVDVGFDDVVLSADQILSSGEAARQQLLDALDIAILGLCASTLGSVERSIELTVEFLGIREQFGRPLAQFQSLQHQVADMYIECNALRSAVYSAIASLRQGRLEGHRGVSACKYKVTTGAKAIIGTALHLHGGIGFTTEYAIGHHYRRAVVNEKLFGDSEHHLARYQSLSMALAGLDCSGHDETSLMARSVFERRHDLVAGI